MVLRGDVASRGAHIDARLIHAAVAILHFVRFATGSKREDLVAKADAKDGHVLSHGPLDGFDGCCSHYGVPEDMRRGTKSGAIS